MKKLILLTLLVSVCAAFGCGSGAEENANPSGKVEGSEARPQAAPGTGKAAL